MSSFKEPNFFVRGYGYDNWDEYLGLFAGARAEKAVGESSTGYLCAEESPKWIKSVLGNIKIILILRNPATRAVSLYWWMVREGYENAPSFVDALELESTRLKTPQFRDSCPELFADYLYFGSGLYSQQVSRFLETFGRENVRIYLFEEFVEDPITICRDIFNFLDVDPTFRPTITVHNEARLPASASLQFWLRNKAPRYLRFVPAKLRRKFLGQLMMLNTRLGSAPRRDPETETHLLERYREDVAQLEQILDRDLSSWFDQRAPSKQSATADYVSLR